MSSFLQTITLSLLITSIYSFSFPSQTQATFARPIDDEEAQQQLGLNFMKEKLTHFKLYWHDTVSGPSPTSITVVNPSKNSSTSFGMINMIDNPLTLGPKLGSKLLGQAQGFYALSSQKYFGLLMSMNFAFIEGKYNGSSITILGRNAAQNNMVREMPVVGGSGLFRFARGFVKAKTYSFDLKSVDAIIQYDCYVMHY